MKGRTMAHVKVLAAGSKLCKNTNCMEKSNTVNTSGKPKQVFF